VKPLTAAEIRESFVNASEADLEHLPMPGLHETVWDAREYLGWRDPNAALRGYLVFWLDDRPVGLILRSAESRMSRSMSAMCSLCRTPQPAHQVALFTAPKAGRAGRDGSTVGTYICSDLGCSTIIRIAPPASDMQPHPSEVIARRSEGLCARLASFTREVLAGSE
jgi:FBP C-terminal treble-clef zinc-finger